MPLPLPIEVTAALACDAAGDDKGASRGPGMFSTHKTWWARRCPAPTV